MLQFPWLPLSLPWACIKIEKVKRAVVEFMDCEYSKLSYHLGVLKKAGVPLT